MKHEKKPSYRNNFFVAICIAHAMTCVVLATACFTGVSGNPLYGVLLSGCAAASVCAGYITILNKWVELFRDWKRTIPFAITGLITIIVPVIIMPWLSVVLIIICLGVIIYRGEI